VVVGPDGGDLVQIGARRGDSLTLNHFPRVV
jgi:hypothetical protein